MAYFWATHTGAELDLLLFVRGRRYGVEVKFQDTPRLTASMRHALDDLRLDRLTVLYPGDRGYDLERQVGVMPLSELATAEASAEITSQRSRRRRSYTVDQAPRPRLGLRRSVKLRTGP